MRVLGGLAGDEGSPHLGPSARRNAFGRPTTQDNARGRQATNARICQNMGRHHVRGNQGRQLYAGPSPIRPSPSPGAMLCHPYHRTLLLFGKVAKQQDAPAVL